MPDRIYVLFLMFFNGLNQNPDFGSEPGEGEQSPPLRTSWCAYAPLWCANSPNMAMLCLWAWLALFLNAIAESVADFLAPYLVIKMARVGNPLIYDTPHGVTHP